MMITCEKCGAAQEDTAHLARHLRDGHGMIASQSIRLAKEMRARYQDADERIRQAALDLLAACESTIRMLNRDQPPTAEELRSLWEQNQAAIAKAKGA